MNGQPLRKKQGAAAKLAQGAQSSASWQISSWCKPASPNVTAGLLSVGRDLKREVRQAATSHALRRSSHLADRPLGITDTVDSTIAWSLQLSLE